MLKIDREHKENEYKRLKRTEELFIAAMCDLENAREEIDQLRRCLASMWFAYVNKDVNDDPHDFELLAIRDTVNYFAEGKDDDPFGAAWTEMSNYLKQKTQQ